MHCFPNSTVSLRWSLSGFNFQPLLLVTLLSARLKGLLKAQHFLLIKVLAKFTHLVTSLCNKVNKWSSGSPSLEDVSYSFPVMLCNPFSTFQCRSWSVRRRTKHAITINWVWSHYNLPYFNKLPPILKVTKPRHWKGLAQLFEEQVLQSGYKYKNDLLGDPILVPYIRLKLMPLLQQLPGDLVQWFFPAFDGSVLWTVAKKSQN